MAQVRLQDVRKSFGSVDVIHGISFDVEDGHFVALLGPSGCGKSTLLRLIAGLEDLTGGQILIGGRDVSDEDPAERGIAMVFQSYALYPHMTVKQNIGFSLEVAKRPKDEIQAKTLEAARMLRLEELLERKPSQLSGGQRQRVAIGRALVRDPSVFLFDEPLSNLDALLRVQMRLELAKLHRKLGSTMIYVTHDQTEAMTLASKIVVLNQGHIAQIGSPVDLYNKPADRFVASFIGSPAMNFLPVSILGSAPRGVTEVGIRPEHVKLAEPRKGTKNIAGTIQLVERLGNATAIHVETSAGTVTALTGPECEANAGSETGLAFDTAKMIGFDADGKARIFGIK
jgi:ABC-type sugar transport system ATPase subunit